RIEGVQHRERADQAVVAGGGEALAEPQQRAGARHQPGWVALGDAGGQRRAGVATERGVEAGRVRWQRTRRSREGTRAARTGTRERAVDALGPPRSPEGAPRAPSGRAGPPATTGRGPARGAGRTRP